MRTGEINEAEIDNSIRASSFVQVKIKLGSDFDQNLSLFLHHYRMTMPQFERNSTESTIERKILRIEIENTTILT